MPHGLKPETIIRTVFLLKLWKTMTLGEVCSRGRMKTHTAKNIMALLMRLGIVQRDRVTTKKTTYSLIREYRNHLSKHNTLP